MKAKPCNNTKHARLLETLKAARARIRQLHEQKSTLLEACKMYCDAYSFISENPPHHSLRDAVMKTRAAIARAEGD